MTTDLVEQKARVMRAKIMNMQRACEALPDGVRMDESPPVTHHFAPGVYCREIHMKAGSAVVGRIHRHKHMNVITQGVMWVFTEFGRQTLKAGDIFSSEPGTKRVVLVAEGEDAIWTTIHPNPTNETDLDKLVEMFTATDYAELGMEVAPLDAPEVLTLEEH